jgi:hypothetical protein
MKQIYAPGSFLQRRDARPTAIEVGEPALFYRFALLLSKALSSSVITLRMPS